VDYFVKMYSGREEKTIEGITAEAMNVLVQYSYPGNIRELENVIERAVVFCEGSFITMGDIPVFLKETLEDDLVLEGLTLPEKINKLEKNEIQRALRKNGGIKSKAARALGVTERILSYKIKTYGIKV